eukprot:6385596-Amphidinium_carterae.1
MPPRGVSAHHAAMPSITYRVSSRLRPFHPQDMTRCHCFLAVFGFLPSSVVSVRVDHGATLYFELGR